MTKIKPLFIAIAGFLLFSCHDTNVIEIEPDSTPQAAPVSGYFKKNVLIEDYTGTWCGNCTRVAYAVQQAEAQSDKVVAIAIHNGNDPYHFAGFEPLQDLVAPGVGLQLPVSRLNRTVIWNYPEPQNIAQVKNLTTNNYGFGLAINSTVVGGNLNVDVKTKFAQSFNNHDLKLVVCVLENHLNYNQVNYSSIYFGGQNPVQNFEHNHVLRSSITNILGDTFDGDKSVGATLTKSFSVPIPSNISNPNNISIVAFVTENNLALNARHADLGENQDFQQNP